MNSKSNQNDKKQRLRLFILTYNNQWCNWNEKKSWCDIEFLWKLPSSRSIQVYSLDCLWSYKCFFKYKLNSDREIFPLNYPITFICHLRKDKKKETNVEYFFFFCLYFGIEFLGYMISRPRMIFSWFQFSQFIALIWIDFLSALFRLLLQHPKISWEIMNEKYNNNINRNKTSRTVKIVFCMWIVWISTFHLV